MEITGTQIVAAPRTVVWTALNDPTVLRQCLPGCESVERSSPEMFRIVMTASIGPLRTRFNGLLRMTEVYPPASCVLVFEGQGGAAGFGKGSSSVTLRETTGGTELSYIANAQLGGKLAQIGSRLLDGVARKMSDDFFAAFSRQFSVSEPADARATTEAFEDMSAAPAGGAVSATAPHAESAKPDGTGATMNMVPAWWLAVAVGLGAAAAIVGALFID